MRQKIKMSLAVCTLPGRCNLENQEAHLKPWSSLKCFYSVLLRSRGETHHLLKHVHPLTKISVSMEDRVSSPFSWSSLCHLNVFKGFEKWELHEGCVQNTTACIGRSHNLMVPSSHKSNSVVQISVLSLTVWLTLGKYLISLSLN